MVQAVHILHLEDDDNDAVLVRRALNKSFIGCQVDVVRSREDYQTRLETSHFDVILSDFSMPGFDGLSALAMARARCPHIPFLFVSGRIGEEAAVESLRQGASDYLTKDRLTRLPAAVARAIKDAADHRKRLEVEAALVEREEMFAAFMNVGPGLAFLKTEDGRLVYANEPLQRWFAARNQEWRGKNESEYLPPAAARMVRENDLQVLRSMAPLKTTELIPDIDGSVRHWFVCKFPFRTSTHPRMIGGYAIDVTEQRSLEQRFLRAQRMESLGILAGGIAHDLNNALLPISLSIEVLKDEVTSPSGVDVLKVMEDSTGRAGSLIRQVLTFARGGNNQKMVINAAHIIRDVCAIARRTFPANITVRCEVGSQLSPLSADPTQLHQVLMNLAVNARDAMPSGGVFSISARNVAPSDVQDHFGNAANSGQYIRIDVSDTGTGIPEEVQDHIFDPFFTTKDAGKGTGLGLSTSLGIIKNHGGAIDFATSPEGTSFSVFFPGVTGAPPIEKIAVPAAASFGAAEVVLIIDDELGAREIAKMVLGRKSYQVVTAPNGVEGLSTFERFQERIDVVLVDHRMPLMDGPETVRSIRKLSARVKIIGMSGHTAHADEFSGAGVDAFLPKPFTAEQLLTTLQDILHSH